MLSIGYGFAAIPLTPALIASHPVLLETLTGSTAPVVVKVTGSNLDELDRVTQEIARVLNTVPGRMEVRAEAQTGYTQVTLHDKDALGWEYTADQSPSPPPLPEA